MPNDNLIRMPCQNCGKKIGIRPDQIGRRVRCPACKSTFRADPPTTLARTNQSARGNAPPIITDDDMLADDAGEIAVVGPPRRAAAYATFSQAPSVVFEATAFAIRRAGAEVTSLDRANLHVRFASAQSTAHSAYVFPSPTGGSELDIRAATAGGRADEVLYSRIASELAAYLQAHSAHALSLAQNSPLLLPSAPTQSRKRKRKNDSVDGFAIGALVASAIGVAVFCIPIVSVPLGIVGVVLSIVSLSQARGNRGLAIAAMILGAVAIVVSGLLFLALVANEMHEQERRRGQYGMVRSGGTRATAPTQDKLGTSSQLSAST